MSIDPLYYLLASVVVAALAGIAFPRLGFLLMVFFILSDVFAGRYT